MGIGKLFLFASVLTLTNVVAQDLYYAKTLFQNKEYKKSFDLLESLLEKDKTNIEISYYMGRSAYELGDFDSAISAYERVLIFNENHFRSRLELGKSYLSMGLKKEALAQFEIVLKSDIPQKVKQNVQKLVDSISAQNSSTSIYLFASLGYDTNINNVPKVEIMTDYIVDTYNLDESGLSVTDEKSSSYLQGLLYLSNMYQLQDNLYLNSSLLTYSQSFFKDSSENILYGKLSSGLDYFDKNYNYGLKLYYEKLFLDSKSYLYGFGITPSISYKVTKNDILTSSFDFGKKRFKDKTKDADYVGFGLSYKKQIDKNRFIFDYRLKNENEKSSNPQDYISYSSNSFKLGYVRSFVDLFDLSTSYTYKIFDYDDSLPTLSKKRDDKQHKLDLKVSRALNNDMTIFMDYGYIDRMSNYVPSKYDKHFISVGLSVKF